MATNLRSCAFTVLVVHWTTISGRAFEPALETKLTSQIEVSRGLVCVLGTVYWVYNRYHF